MSRSRDRRKRAERRGEHVIPLDFADRLEDMAQAAYRAAESLRNISKPW